MGESRLFDFEDPLFLHVDNSTVNGKFTTDSGNRDGLKTEVAEFVTMV